MQKSDSALRSVSLAVIGGGAMGEAMISSLLTSHVLEPKAITVSDPHKERMKDLEARYGIHAAPQNLGAVKDASVGVEGVARESVPELPAHERKTQALSDEQRGVGVPEVVKAQFRLRLVIDARSVDRSG